MFMVLLYELDTFYSSMLPKVKLLSSPNFNIWTKFDITFKKWKHSVLDERQNKTVEIDSKKKYWWPT